jgi:hypothetical protein
MSISLDLWSLVLFCIELFLPSVSVKEGIYGFSKSSPVTYLLLCLWSYNVILLPRAYAECQVVENLNILISKIVQLAQDKKLPGLNAEYRTDVLDLTKMSASE